ncbi:MAG: uncharacterized membrane protein YbaN (DUF454 family) [Brevundimonas sp.]
MISVRTALYRALGGGAMALALVGIATPILPTTPFLLVAAWALGRGAPRLRARLDAHPTLGPVLGDWETRPAIPARGKVAAVAGLSASWGVIALSAPHPAVLILSAMVMSGVGFYVLT